MPVAGGLILDNPFQTKSYSDSIIIAVTHELDIFYYIKACKCHLLTVVKERKTITNGEERKLTGTLC